MGRRPHRVVQLFFDRGRKLQDASNRYQHTCKKCGEQFNKGRQETLILHVTKRCPRVTQEERERFLLDINFGTQSSTIIASPQTPNQSGLSGLDALAEVSRQHGHIDYAAQQAAIADEFLNSDHGEQENSSPSVAGAAHQPWPVTSNGFPTSSPYATLAHHRPAPVAPMTSTASYRMAEAALNVLDPNLSRNEAGDSLQNQLRQHALVDYSFGEPPSVDLHHVRHANLQPAQDDAEQRRPTKRPRRESLVNYSHGEPPSLEGTHSRHSVVQYVTNQSSSPQEGSIESPMSDTEPSQIEPTFADYTHVTSPQNGQPHLQQPGENGYLIDQPIESESPMVDNTELPFGGVWDTYNPAGSSPLIVRKVRGAFAPDRRSAVKSVRKIGACLRCRMLKKSCDSGDPCKECAKLETARLWRGQCVRTRLTKIFEVYASGLFMVLAHHAVETAKQSGSLEIRPGRLEVSYFPSSGILVTFPYLEVHKPGGSSVVLINIDNEEQFSDKLTLGNRPLKYAGCLLQKHHETKNGIFKVSNFMNATLTLAMEMDQRVLITKVLELWICTTLLSQRPSDLRAFTSQSQTPADVIVDSKPGKDNRAVAVDAIYLQIRRALEKSSEILFKIVMIELEKSLIQRKQSDNLETFIGTVLLLRCVEQVCYLYRTFDAQEESDPTPSTAGNAYKSPYKPPPRDWPLDKPPHYFWQQGERFSDLLCSMLRLRKVPPNMEIRDGVLVTIGEPAKVQQWCESIQLRLETLEEAKTRPFDAEDETAWELRWIGKAFLKFDS